MTSGQRADVVIDITRLLGRCLRGHLPTGIDRVNLEYVRHYHARATGLVRFGDRWLELGQRDSRRLFGLLLDRSADRKASIRWIVGRAYVLNSCTRPGRGRVFLNVGHSGLDLPEYEKRLRGLGFTPIFFVHDLIPISHPEYCRPGEAQRHEGRMKTVLDVGRGVVCNSHATLRDLETFAQRMGYPMPQTTVAPLAPAELPPPDARPPLDEPYFVVLGTIEPRKNHWFLLHVWRELATRLGDRTPKLVVIGQRGWECENVVDMLERCSVLRGHVLELPFCSDCELSTYLRHAKALLFPSFKEGFGMPLVEALSLGTPVIASDQPVFREIAGEIPEYLSPLDGFGWMRKVELYSSAVSTDRVAQLDRMRGFQSPDWNTHFQRVDDLMERLGR